MHCQRCGKELGNSAHCKFCGYYNAREGSVREMSANERLNFNGITIDSGGEHHQRFDSSARESFIHVNQSNIWAQLFGTHIVTRILVALVLLMLLAFAVFVALPLLLTVLGVFAVYYFVRNVAGRR